MTLPSANRCGAERADRGLEGGDAVGRAGGSAEPPAGRFSLRPRDLCSPCIASSHAGTGVGPLAVGEGGGSAEAKTGPIRASPSGPFRQIGPVPFFASADHRCSDRRGSPSSPFSLHGFVGSSIFSYLVATVMAAVAFSIAWGWKTSRPLEVARHPAGPDGAAEQPRPETPLVGRITGMADCQWADPATAAFKRDGVRLGRKYALASGFLEITYDSGAKVILQGPATYEVESSSSGFLSLGKLTARVEKKSAVGSRQSAVSPQSESLPTAHYPLSTGRGSKGERTANLALSCTEKVAGRTNHFARPSPLDPGRSESLKSEIRNPIPLPSPLSPLPLFRPHSHGRRDRPGHRVRRRGRPLGRQPGTRFSRQS